MFMFSLHTNQVNPDPNPEQLTRFLRHEATRSISTRNHPPLMGCWSIAGLPPSIKSLVRISRHEIDESSIIQYNNTIQFISS